MAETKRLCPGRAPLIGLQLHRESGAAAPDDSVFSGKVNSIRFNSTAEVGGGADISSRKLQPRSF